MSISKNKKRYNLTMSPVVVERFQTLCRKLHLPPSTMSNLCEDAISNVSDTFQLAVDKGNFQLSDLFKVMGKQLQLLEDDKKRSEK